MEKLILLYGLNRSGTNYMEELMKKHFVVKFLNNEDHRNQPKHKHFRLYDNKSLIGRPNYKNQYTYKKFQSFENAVSDEEKPDIYIIVSKDPYSWNLSYTKWGEKHNWGKSPHPYIMEYNEFYGKWMNFSEETEKIVFIRYIDLLVDWKKVLKNLQVKFKLDPLISIEESKVIKKVPMSRRFTSRKNKYYTRAKYLKEYTQEELELLNKNIDHQLIEKLGYKSYY